jgi:hypothetical protein
MYKFALCATNKKIKKKSDEQLAMDVAMEEKKKSYAK